MNEGPSPPRVRRATAVRLGAAAVVLLTAVVTVPSVRAAGKAPTTLARAITGDVPRPLAPPVHRSAAVLGGTPGDLYTPGWRAPGVVLVPGATPAGRDDARAVRAATALAEAGREVFVPELALYERVLDEADVKGLRDATHALARRSGRSVGLVGFSYGGAYALLAAADLTSEVLAQVAVFGAYFDLGGVIQAATTGASVVGGRVLEWDGDPAAPALVTDVILRELATPAQGAAVRAVLEGRADERALDDDAAAFHTLLVNDDPRRTPGLLAGLPDTAREHIARFSPSAVAHRITAPVVALHARDDPAVPYAEGEKLAASIPGARFVGVDLFDHVDFTAPAPGDLLRAAPDLLATWRYGRWLLTATEPWAPATARRLGARSP